LAHGLICCFGNGTGWPWNGEAKQHVFALAAAFVIVQNNGVRGDVGFDTVFASYVQQVTMVGT
jgi:hypothetical protein